MSFLLFTLDVRDYLPKINKQYLQSRHQRRGLFTGYCTKHDIIRFSLSKRWKMNYVRERESGTFLVAQMFFLSSKRVRDLLIPIEILPSTQSPAVKVTTEGAPREKSIRISPSTMFVVNKQSIVVTSHAVESSEDRMTHSCGQRDL